MSEAVCLKPQKDVDDLAPDATQRVASDPHASVWVNASAGSGKTTILTNRVTRLLLDGVKPERILCLTFTRAAAAEMAIRVTRQLSYWATCSDDELRKDLDRLQGITPKPEQLTIARQLFVRVLACPGGMRIHTLHAFCQEILRRFPIEAGLSPHFTVLEEGDARVLRDEAKEDLLRRATHEPSSLLGRALNALVCDLGEHGFSEAMQGVLSERHRFAAALDKEGGVENLITAMRTRLSLAPDETIEVICHQAVDEAVLYQKNIQQAAEWLLEGTKSYIPRGAQILAWLALTPKERVARFDDYARCFLTSDGKPFAHFGNKDLLAKYPDLEVILGREADRLRTVQERLDTALIAENTAAVLVFGAELIHRYEGRKRAQAALDYDDLIRHTDELLRRPGIASWVLYKLDGGLDHILVDEAQDTSRVQWSIVASLADEFFAGAGVKVSLNRTLFVVGDEKQSIFSFQHADPEAFISRRRFFSQRIQDAEKQYREVPLRTSFRSAPAILHVVDQVFSRDHVRAGVSLEPVQHQADKREKIGHVEVWPLIAAIEKEKAEAENSLWMLPLGYEREHDPQAELAAEIAEKIKGWLTHQEPLVGEKRAIVPGDIMILLRRRGGFADLMVRALKERGVPVTGVDRMRLIQQLPVMDMLALMQFMLLPEDDLTLATVLRGPLINFDEDQLMRLAVGRSGTLWQRLAEKTHEEASFEAAHAYLMRRLNEADFMSPFVMLARVLNEPCPGSEVSGRCALWLRLGPDALDPLDELLNAAQVFSHHHFPSLQAFLHWLMATEAEIKRELDRGGGQVRIMTVHAAKGLEAPIVFLPDTASLPRMQDMPKFLWDETGLPLYLSRRPDLGMARQVWETARQRQMEEYRRLLYVALTRAANRLYIGGWEMARKEANSDESWYSLIITALKGEESKIETTQAEEGNKLNPIISFSDPVLPFQKEQSEIGIFSTPRTPLPLWARQPVLPEPEAIQQIAPSRLAEMSPVATPDTLFARGRIIHRLLQSLPEIEDAGRDKAATQFLANPQHRLTSEQQTEVKGEVLKLLRHPDYAELFAVDSRAEVPLVGRIGHQTVVGQVDRLCFHGDSIWIVDYKTNRPPPLKTADVPEAYRHQMASYRAVLQSIYPLKTIRCFLLWTYGPSLMELEK